MKKIVGYSLVAVLSFGLGAVAGWFTRKKTSEVQFEVTDIQELNPEDSDLVYRPADVNKAIDMHFQHDTPVMAKVTDIQEEDDGLTVHAEPVMDVNTQKEQYFKKWKAEEAVDKYDTRTKEDPEDPVVSEDLEEGFDPDFIGEAEHEAFKANRPEIEPASMEDWNHWISIQDGDYDCVEVHWFTGDNVLTDEEDKPLGNPGKYMGFDVAEQFRTVSEEMTGDPDIRIVYNHKQDAIFQIIRIPGKYNRKRGMEEFGSEYDGDGDDES